MLDFFLPKQGWELFLSKGTPTILAFGNKERMQAIALLKQDPSKLDFWDVNNFFYSKKLCLSMATLIVN